MVVYIYIYCVLLLEHTLFLSGVEKKFTFFKERGPSSGFRFLIKISSYFYFLGRCGETGERERSMVKAAFQTNAVEQVKEGIRHSAVCGNPEILFEGACSG